MELTCVTGYWAAKNKHNNNYLTWFNNTLKINCPYIVFSNKKGIELLKKYRENLPTYYIQYNIDDFYTNKYKHKLKPHPEHCPSVELYMIWNEKIILMDKAKQINPFNSNYFAWVDAGLCTYRDQAPPTKPFPNINKLKYLPTNKFIYSSSEYWHPNFVSKNRYYHHISGTYILHKNFIDKFTPIYKEYMDKLIDENNIWTDQVIHTHIFYDKPELFFKLCDGYGTIFNILY
jgi:hypothetical protein